MGGLAKQAVELGRAITPLPVAVRPARGVETALGAEAEQIRQGDDRQTADRGIRGADEIPPDLRGAYAQIAAHVIARLLPRGCVPAEARVVVVRAGINDAVGFEIVRQVEIVALAAEGELQDRHPRQAGISSKLPRRGRKLAEVLRDDLGIRKGAADRLEEGHAGARQPLAFAGGGGRIRNPPVVGKAAEMVDPHHVVELESGAHPGVPPRESIGGMHIPAVERIAPQLAVLTEIVRRHAGDRQRPARLLIEFEQVRAGPGIRAVHGHKNRNVADDLQPPPRRGRTHPAPLTEEQILRERVRRHRLLELAAQPRRSRLCVDPRLLGPVPPGPPFVVILQRPEIGVGFEPRGVRLLECLEGSVNRRAAPAAEVLICAGEHGPDQPVQPAVVDAICVEKHQGAKRLLPEQTVPRELHQVD